LEKYKKAGMRDCVAKPFPKMELWRCLLKHLTPVGFSPVDEAAQARDDDDLRKKLRLKFVKDNQLKSAEISEAIAAGDIPLAHRLAHTLKGNAGQIGKPALQDAAAGIEALLKEGTIPKAEQMISLETELSAVLEELTPLLEAHDGQALPESLNKEQARELFDRLLPMLENINPECVDLLAEIRAIPGTEELAQQIEDYEFESAARTLADLRKDREQYNE